MRVSQRSLHKSPILLLVVVTAFGAFRVAPVKPSPRNSRPQPTIVIDASRDGGAWWFPQGPAPFDADKWHQGSELAAYLRGRGWNVVQIPRGEKITRQLRNATFVVRMSHYQFPYQPSELAAYRKFIKRGGRLLLLQAYVRDGEADKDLLAKLLGVRFAGLASGVVMEPIDSSAAADFENVDYQIGSVVTTSPLSTKPIARLNDGRLVMGRFRYGKGTVIFLSSVFPALHVTPSFTNRLFDELNK